MASEEFGLSREVWQKVEELFGRMIESDDPDSILAQESDPEIAAIAGRLYRNHQQAEEAHFIEEPITLVKGLTAPASPRFAAGDLLAGRFLVQALLGAGGMGEVYCATDQRLGGNLAIKTIRTHLASDRAVRLRFLDEIQNARCVTHANVCRIFDLFDEGETLCFSMEYLDGTTLENWLADASAPRQVRQRVAIDLAEGLLAAHRNGIVHCDFKPGNVLMTGDSAHPRPVITDFGLARALSSAGAANAHFMPGGTLEYMAPELRAGSMPDIRSDIYAYGRVLRRLLPEDRAGLACSAERREDRPLSLEAVLSDWRKRPTRRVWIAVAAAAPLAGAGGYEILQRPRLPLLGRQRIAVNAFLPSGLKNAALVRDLLITALRQSLLVSIVSDEKIRAMLNDIKFPAASRPDTPRLLAAAAHEGIELVLEGALRETGAGFQFLLQVFRPGNEKAAFELSKSVPDRAHLVDLTSEAVQQLRREFGESSATLRAGRLQDVTSPKLDAVTFYFEGVRLYDTAQAEAAIAYFDNAIVADPQFALAHLFRALALAARFNVPAALPSYERAWALRERVSERERLWIEFQCHSIYKDHVSSLNPSRRLAALYPDESTFQRNVAFAYAASGHPLDALPYSRRAVELDGSNDNNLSELIVNHAEANRFDEALEIYSQLRSQGHNNTLLDWGAGIAWMGKGEWENARASFARMGSDAKRSRWASIFACAPAILEGRFAEVAATLESDLAYDIATGEQNHVFTRRIWLGYLEWLMGRGAATRLQAEYLAALDPSPAFLEYLREGALLAVKAKAPDLVQTAIASLRKIEDRWPSTHSRGVRAHVESVAAQDGNTDAASLGEAMGLWPDPPVLLSHAQWLERQGDFAAAYAACERLEEQRGRILKRYFPGLLVLGQIEKARCLERMSRFEDAQRLLSQTANFWRRVARDHDTLQ